MKFWLHVHDTEPEEIVDLAIFAEEVGFTGVLDGDHWYWPSNPAAETERAVSAFPDDVIYPDNFVVGSMVTVATRTLKFATSVLVLANRTNPLIVAKASSTLSRMSNGRFVLGVGLGWLKTEYDVAGVDWTTRAARMEEMIVILRKLWAAGPVEHHGTFFNFGPTWAEPRPKTPVPISIAARIPAALRRAGRIGDGWMGELLRVDEVPSRIALINEARREAGRDHLPFDFMSGLAPGEHGLEDYQRLEEAGLTSVIFGPITWLLNNRKAGISAKKRLIEKYANEVIRSL